MTGGGNLSLGEGMENCEIFAQAGAVEEHRLPAA